MWPSKKVYSDARFGLRGVHSHRHQEMQRTPNRVEQQNYSSNHGRCMRKALEYHLVRPPPAHPHADEVDMQDRRLEKRQDHDDDQKTTLRH